MIFDVTPLLITGNIASQSNVAFILFNVVLMLEISLPMRY